MKSKRIFTLMLALVMTLSLAACGGSKQEEAPADNAGNGEAAGDTQDFGGAELVVATWGWAEAGLKTLAADFESKYNCTIVVDPTSGNGDRLNKLMAEKNASTADVAMLTKSYDLRRSAKPRGGDHERGPRQQECRHARRAQDLPGLRRGCHERPQAV